MSSHSVAMTKAEYDKIYYEKNKERIRAHAKIWYEANRGKAQEANRKWRSKHPEKPAEYKKRWLEKNPELRSQVIRDYHIRLRRAAIEHYGGKNPKCMCPGICAEATYEFLCIDHINGGTAGKRGTSAHVKYGGTLYQWLKRHNYPLGFQVLCHNCNIAKAAYGKCPHQK